MALYAVGDIQGCYRPLRSLLDRIGFDPEIDHLWCTGDLVNRGPDSLAVLRYVKSLGGSATVVLGNHDLHLLARAYGHRVERARDTFEAVLKAPDRDELLHWLRHRPLLVGRGAWIMLHAGLVPSWTLADARARAREVEAVLRGADFESLLAHMYGDRPDQWSASLTGWDRLRVIINVLTRLRYCDAEGRMMLDEVGPPNTVAPPWAPWYTYRAESRVRYVFGHWSSLGVSLTERALCLDGGCVWGRELAAARLKDQGNPKIFTIPCANDEHDGC